MNPRTRRWWLISWLPGLTELGTNRYLMIICIIIETRWSIKLFSVYVCACVHMCKCLYINALESYDCFSPASQKVLRLMNNLVSKISYFSSLLSVAQYRHHYFSTSIVILFVMPETTTAQRLNTIYIHINHWINESWN